MISGDHARNSATQQVESWNKSNSFLRTSRCRLPNPTWAANRIRGAVNDCIGIEPSPEPVASERVDDVRPTDAVGITMLSTADFGSARRSFEIG